MKENQTDLTFSRKSGTCGIKGQHYEIYLSLYFLLEGFTRHDKNQLKEFLLVSNIKDVGIFDDVVFKYTNTTADNLEKSKTIFLQAKHKENPNKSEHQITIDKLFTIIKEYFESYRKIKKQFSAKKHSLFGGEFENCELIFFTNAKTNKEFDNEVSELLEKCEDEEHNMLKFDQPGYYYKIVDTGERKQEIINDLKNASNDSEDIDEINEYLDKLRFYINQPGVDDLKKILTKKIETYYAIEECDSNDMFSIIKRKVEDWFTDGKECLSEKNKNEFLNLMRFSIQFEVAAPVLNFTGRETELKNLHTNLTENTSGNVTIISQMASVSGLGGIGKTELAKQYIHKYREFYNDNIIWLNSENEDILTDSFKRLCNRLNIKLTITNNQPKDFRSIVVAVYNFFANRKSIFVFDNAENTKYIEECLRLQYSLKKSNKPYILITSRDKNWQNEIKIIELDELKTEDAFTLVKSGLNINDDSEDEFVLQLIKKLQNYPLAIQQAISYINSENEVGVYTISDYINGFDSKSKSLLNSHKFRGITNIYNKTTFTTWNLTKEIIERDKEYGKLALEILNIISYFSPDNIKRDMFLMLVDDDEIKLKNAVRLLVNLSMVNGKEKQSIISVHRLVQKVTRIELELKNDSETLKKALQLIEKAIHEEYFYIDHAIAALNYLKTHECLKEQFQDLPNKVIRKLRSYNISRS